MKPRLISAIIPVFNGERYLAEAIESVLAQSYRPIEVIVVDDGSTDLGAAIAKSYSRVRYCYQPNGGASSARNRGLELADGEWFSFLDADDLWMVEKLERQMAALERNSGADGALGYVEQFYSPEMADSLKARISCLTERMPAYHQNAMLIRREAFFRVGVFDTSLQLGETVEWFVRARHLGLKMLMLPDVVFRRRLHGANQGLTKSHYRQQYVRILKAALDRRRRPVVE